MQNSNNIITKIWVSLIIVISVILISFSFYFYTTKPSLHYLGIFYFSAGIITLGIVQFLILITKSSVYKVKLNYVLFGSGILTSLPILIDGNISATSRIIGILFCAVSILSLLYLLLKFKKEKDEII